MWVELISSTTERQDRPHAGRGSLFFFFVCVCSLFPFFVNELFDTKWQQWKTKDCQICANVNDSHRAAQKVTDTNFIEVIDFLSSYTCNFFFCVVFAFRTFVRTSGHATVLYLNFFFLFHSINSPTVTQRGTSLVLFAHTYILLSLMRIEKEQIDGFDVCISGQKKHFFFCLAIEEKQKEINKLRLGGFAIGD